MTGAHVAIRYRIVDALPPAMETIATAAYQGECTAYGEEPEHGSNASRSGDVVCSLIEDHAGPHWDQWDRSSWELVG